MSEVAKILPLQLVHTKHKKHPRKARSTLRWDRSEVAHTLVFRIGKKQCCGEKNRVFHTLRQSSNNTSEKPATVGIKE